MQGESKVSLVGRAWRDCVPPSNGENAMTQATGTSKASDSIEMQCDLEGLPPFPAVALQALKLMSGSDTSLIELCNLIRTDPAFSTAVLRIANSPLVAFSKTVTNVLQASMLLGFRRLKSVVITVGMKAYLQQSSTPLMQSCWQHSVACAIIAERSASQSAMDKDFAYTAGILHDIGRVALVTLMPKAYARVIERGADDPQDLLQVERELCGIDHCQAGHALVTAWSLPKIFLEIASCHHRQEGHLPGASGLIPPSCELADSLGFAVVRCRSPRSYAKILATFSERAQNGFPPEGKELRSEIEKQIKVIESA